MANTNRIQHASHQAQYRIRRKKALQPRPRSWDWMTLADVQKLAVDAYKSASFVLAKGELNGSMRDREIFVEHLMMYFGAFVATAAHRAGMQTNVVDRLGKDPEAVLACTAGLREMIADWNPQYPLYKELTPASAANASGVVINADEGNVNGPDFSH